MGCLINQVPCHEKRLDIDSLILFFLKHRPISLRLVGPGKYHESYIEHLPDRYLVIRGHQISCEPLKTEDVDDCE